MKDKAQACGADSSTELGGWMPIQTAPRDGTHIIVAYTRRGLFGENRLWAEVVKWDAHYSGWSDDSTEYVMSDSDFSHWAPLMPAPKDGPKCCDQCDDGDGFCIFPNYGPAPHTHDTSNGWIGSTRLLPREQWGDNFREDAEVAGYGTYMRCPNCGRGEQPVPELGLLPLGPRDHPEPRTMVWSALELAAIKEYAARCVAAERERCAAKLDALGCDHCAAAIRMSPNTEGEQQ